MNPWEKGTKTFLRDLFCAVKFQQIMNNSCAIFIAGIRIRDGGGSFIYLCIYYNMSTYNVHCTGCLAWIYPLR